MKVAIVGATPFEWQPIQQGLNTIEINPLQMQVMFFTTGIGVMATTYTLMSMVDEWKPDLVIQAGIAGSFEGCIPLAEVVAVRADGHGDLVVEEKDELKDLFDLGLQEVDVFPYSQKMIINPWLDKLPLQNIQQAMAVTVSEITTQAKRIQQLQYKYGAELETMEGVALHYVCSKKEIPFLQLKAISNVIGERNKEHWKIAGALQNLSAIVLQVIKNLSEEKLQ